VAECAELSGTKNKYFNVFVVTKYQNGCNLSTLCSLNPLSLIFSVSCSFHPSFLTYLSFFLSMYSIDVLLTDVVKNVFVLFSTFSAFFLKYKHERRYYFTDTS